MRGGPSTGIPAKSEQSDLSIALYGLRGDAPHLVVAPNGIADCAFATSSGGPSGRYLQTAAIVLSDQSWARARATISQPADPACARSADARGRGRRTPPPLCQHRVGRLADGRPGTPGITYTADGLEHNEFGIPSSGAADHSAQLDKRLRKLPCTTHGTHWPTSRAMATSPYRDLGFDHRRGARGGRALPRAAAGTPACVCRSA